MVMATVDDTSNRKKAADVGPAETARQWVEYAAGEVAELKRSALAAADSAVSAAGSGLSQLLSAASAAAQESKGLMESMKSQYEIHEELAVAKIKEGICIAAAHPEISCAAAAGMGLVVLKSRRPLEKAHVASGKGSYIRSSQPAINHWKGSVLRSLWLVDNIEK